jgi:hypothetical protein
MEESRLNLLTINRKVDCPFCGESGGAWIIGDDGEKFHCYYCKREISIMLQEKLNRNEYEYLAGYWQKFLEGE